MALMVVAGMVVHAEPGQTPLFLSASDAIAAMDHAACRVYARDHEPVVAPADVLNRILSPDGGKTYWQSPPTAQGTVHHVLRWKTAILIGSVLAQDAVGIAIERPGVTDPDPWQDDDWESLELHGTGQGKLGLAAQAREVLFVRITNAHNRHRGVGLVRIAPTRLINVAPQAAGFADGEYTVHPEMGSPYTLGVNDLLACVGPWQNAGPARDGFVTRALVALEPAWVILAWQEAVTLDALWIEGNASSFRIQVFTGPDGVHPAAALEDEWRTIRAHTTEGPEGNLLAFDPALTVRAMRVLITDVHPIRLRQGNSHPNIARLDVLMALRDRVNGEEGAPVVEQMSPPVLIPVDVPEAGTVSVVIDGSDGRRVRNLLARHPVEAGRMEVPWELLREGGAQVEPGVYHWTALSLPELTLRYEMTPYPNVQMHADNPPWLTGIGGSGGWLADHTAPRAVATSGDRVFFGSPTAEGGAALIGCNLEGQKLWGSHNLMAWTGPSYLASDDEWVYAGAPIDGADRVWRLGRDGRQRAVHIDAPATADRLRGLRGMAVGGGRLYVSVATRDADVFDRAATFEDVDFDAVIPSVRPPQESQRGTIDDRRNLARLFRLTGTPPGNSVGLVALQTTDMPALRQHIMIPFKRPVRIGSLALPRPGGDAFLQISTLLPDAPYPPDPDRDADWVTVHRSRDRGWTVLALPSGGETRALRITFDRAEDDMDAMLMDMLAAPSGDGIGLEAGGLTSRSAPHHSPWKTSLDGMALLRYRLEAISDMPEVRVNSGQIDEEGVWDAQRTRPLTQEDPGVYAMIWDAPHSVRGLAIQEIDGQFTEIDVYEGPDTGAVDVMDDRFWRQVARYEQRLRYYYDPHDDHNSRARYMDGYVDFGESVQTRAIRLRVVETWREDSMWGVRSDRGGRERDPARCRVYGVAAVRLLDALTDDDVLRTDRIEVYDDQGKGVGEWPLTRPGPLTVAPDGHTLYAVSGAGVSAVDTRTGKATPLDLDLYRADGLACDKAGNLYVFDRGKDHLNIRVFDPESGTLIRTIGTPGGYRPGPWDPMRITSGPGVAVALAIDVNERLWVVENDHLGKRISRWRLDGTFEKEVVGPPRYGGGGVLDPWDKSRLYYQDGGATLVFDLDWDTGATRVAGIASMTPHGYCEVPVRRDGHHYLVSRPGFMNQPVGRVFHVTDGVARLVAAMGQVNLFRHLRNPEVLAVIGRRPLSELSFVWSDLNGDGEVQPDELVLLPADSDLGAFDRELGIHSSTRYYRVGKILPNGVPIYEVEALPDDLAGVGTPFRLPDGTRVVMGNDLGGHAGFDASGRRRWFWPTEGFGVHAYYAAGPYTPAQVTAEFGVIGAERMDRGDLGVFYAMHANTGTWHLWSADGILFGRIFLDIREPGRQSLSMPEHHRGLDLSRITLGQEPFAGYLCKLADGDQVYAVAGHTSINVIEVKGLDRARRQTGTVTVDRHALQQAEAWMAGQARQALHRRAPVIRARRVERPRVVDGLTHDWPADPDARLEDGRASFRIGYDNHHLYALWDVRDCGPFLNEGDDWRRLFKSGAIVDLMIGADVKADPARKVSVPGDQRLVIAPFQGKPVAVRYRPVAADSVDHQPWEARTEVAQARFDDVRILDDVQIAVQASPGDPSRYTVEVAVPLEALGMIIDTRSARMRFDWGVQEVDVDGNTVFRRLYWANRAARTVADEATEARLDPAQWGDLLTVSAQPSASLPGVEPVDPVGIDLMELLD